MNDIERIHAVILEELMKLPDIQYVGFLPKRYDTIALPAILVDLAELEPARDPGSGELGLYAHWEARILISNRGNEAEIWNIVQAVLFWLFDFHWPSLNVQRAKIKQAAPDHFSPEFQGHRIWLIEWVNEIRVEDNILEGEGIIPEIYTVDINGNKKEELVP